MMKSLAILALLSTAAWAQSSDTASSTASASSSLPSDGVSKSCRKFLQSLDSDDSLANCIAPLIYASAPYAPGGSGSSGDVKDTLTSICNANSCDASTVQGKLADFSSACNTELTSSNEEVIGIYDAMYFVIPFKNAVCCKGDSGDYCALSVSKYASGDDVQAAQKSLSSGSAGNAFSANNLAFFFLTDATDSNYLCTTCTRNVLTSFIDFESDTPYAPGLTNSELMGGQSKLYSGVGSTCGTSFLSGAVQAAGGLKNDSPFGSNNGAGRVASTGLGAAVLAAAASALVFAL